MRYYKDIIKEIDPEQTHRYHDWSQESVSRFWQIFSSNPLLRQQFYPEVFWSDLLGWAAEVMGSEPLRAADLGCGGGTVVASVNKRFPGAAVTGFDISGGSLSSVPESIRTAPGVSLCVGRLPRLPLAGDTLDLAVCTEVLEHLEPEVFGAAFAEVSRVLKSGGYFLFTLPIGERMNVMVCPHCSTIFTPNQHLNFEISAADIERRLSRNGFRLEARYVPIDRSRPLRWHRALLKDALIRFLPSFSRRIFSRAGVSGFLAVKG